MTSNHVLLVSLLQSGHVRHAGLQQRLQSVDLIVLSHVCCTGNSKLDQIRLLTRGAGTCSSRGWWWRGRCYWWWWSVCWSRCRSCWHFLGGCFRFLNCWSWNIWNKIYTLCHVQKLNNILIHHRYIKLQQGVKDYATMCIEPSYMKCNSRWSCTSEWIDGDCKLSVKSFRNNGLRHHRFHEIRCSLFRYLSLFSHKKEIK